jgi:hypothetical protein
MLTIFGACAVTFMMLMYALERRGRGFILAFACGCAMSSVYGFLAGTWPFGVVEAIWSAIALRRYMQTPPDFRQRQAEIAEPRSGPAAEREPADLLRSRQ